MIVKLVDERSKSWYLAVINWYSVVLEKGEVARLLEREASAFLDS